MGFRVPSVHTDDRPHVCERYCGDQDALYASSPPRWRTSTTGTSAASAAAIRPRPRIQDPSTRDLAMHGRCGWEISHSAFRLTDDPGCRDTCWPRRQAKVAVTRRFASHERWSDASRSCDRQVLRVHGSHRPHPDETRPYSTQRRYAPSLMGIGHADESYCPLLKLTHSSSIARLGRAVADRWPQRLGGEFASKCNR